MNLPLSVFSENALSDAKYSLRKRLYQLFSSNLTFSTCESLKQIVRLEEPIFNYKPLQWLQFQNHSVKIYWSDRNSEFESAGIGLADKITCDDDYHLKLSIINKNLGVLSGRARYYGGMRFNLNTNIDEIWRPFGSCFFILPRFELFSNKAGTYLACNIVIEPGKQLHDNIKCILEFIDEIRETNKELMPSRQIEEFARQDLPSKTDWFININSALKMLKSREIEKIVLGRSTLFWFDKALRPLSLLQRLKEVEPIAYHFYIQPQEGSAFIGATPERLYKRQGRFIQSEAVAGTCPRGMTPEDDKALAETLLRSDKNHHEHICVRDNLALLLRQCCKYLEVNDEVKLLLQSRVQHLYSFIQGQLLDNISDMDLLKRLHPTPAVGGLPRDKALENIENLEPFDRGWYAGPIGWIAKDSAEFAVAIRSGLVTDKSVKIFAGAGVVEGSSPQLEWDEMETKISAFMNALGI